MTETAAMASTAAPSDTGSAKPRVAALIVAAGRGVRAGGGVPKQYRLLAGRTVLRRAVDAFLAHPEVDAVRCVIGAEDEERYRSAVGALGLPDPVFGGETRQESVSNGLKSLQETMESPPDIVLIHDAARPDVPAAMISRVIRAAAETGAAVPALAVADTLKRGRAGADGALHVEETAPRDALYAVQTPQGFRFADILAAHCEAALVGGAPATDDAGLFEAMGKTVVLVPGAWEAQKLTTAEDFARAERLLAGALETRVGVGYDVHRFTAGDHVTLCGLRIPHDRGLAGHSDADVGLHALTDAILGALGDGDIGRHFPPSDPQWRGADSAAFLAHAVGLVAARGGAVRHLDVTLICEAPKIGPHREAMRRRIAAIAGVALARVSVKATTTEGLGFTGRKEGAAAQATATLALPSLTDAPDDD